MQFFPMDILKWTLKMILWNALSFPWKQLLWNVEEIWKRLRIKDYINI